MSLVLQNQSLEASANLARDRAAERKGAYDAEAHIETRALHYQECAVSCLQARMKGLEAGVRADKNNMHRLQSDKEHAELCLADLQKELQLSQERSARNNITFIARDQQLNAVIIDLKREAVAASKESHAALSALRNEASCLQVRVANS